MAKHPSGKHRKATPSRLFGCSWSIGCGISLVLILLLGSVAILIQPGPVPPAVAKPDLPALQTTLLAMINQRRHTAGFSDLRADAPTALAGSRHAEELATFAYQHSLNLEGLSPQRRATLAESRLAVREVLFLYQPPNAPPSDQTAWEAVIGELLTMLLSEPETRQIILDPKVTGVGIGLGFAPHAGRLALALQFVSDAVVIQPLATTLAADASLELVGQVVPGFTTPVLELAYEPLPTSRTLSELSQSSPYRSAATTLSRTPLLPDATGVFTHVVSLSDPGLPGHYHLRIYADGADGSLAAAAVVVEMP
jgi:uncharacterized protein YkwD